MNKRKSSEKKKGGCANMIAVVLVGIVLTFAGLLWMGDMFEDTPSASPTAEALGTYREVDGLVLGVDGVESVVVAGEREHDEQVNSVVMVTIAGDADLVAVRDALWDVWSADAGVLYDKRLVMDLTITQGDTETIWQYTSDSIEWLQLQ